MFRKYSILIVDDTIANLLLLETLLEDELGNIHTISDSTEVIPWLEKNTVNLILLDVRMPEINGFELCEKIKQLPEYTDTPILFITSLNDKENVLRGLQAGAVDYIFKPFEEEELKLRINIHLQIQEQKEKLREANKKLQNAYADIEAKSELLLSEKLFSQRIIQTSNAFIVGLDHNQNILLFNNGAQKISGYSQEEVLGKNWFDVFIAPEDLVQVKQVWKKAWGSKIYTNINPIVTKSGQKKHISWNSTGIYQKNTPNEEILISIGDDITEQIESKIKLKTEKDFTESIIETSSAIIVGLDIDKKVKIFNLGAENITGYKKEEVLNKNWFDIFIIPELHENINAVWDDAWQKPRQKYTNPIRTKTGEERIISWQSTGIKDEQSNQTLMLSIGEDVTEHKKTEALLLESLNINKTIIDYSPLGIALYRKDGQCEIANNAIAKMVGAKDKEDVLNQSFHKIESWKSSGLYQIALDVLKTNEYKIYALKSVSSFGKEVDLNCHLIPIDLKNEKHLLLIVEDISVRKAFEQKLKQSEIKLESILETAPVGIGVAINRVFKEVNNTVCEITGYTKEELLGENTRFLYLDEDSFIKADTLRLKNRAALGKIKYETKWKRKNGEIIDVQVNSAPIDPQNIHSGLTFSVTDITQAKTAKLKLEQNEQKLQQILNANTDIVIVFKENLDIQYVNKAGQQVFDQSPGKKCHEIIFGLKEQCSWCAFNNKKNDSNMSEITNAIDGKKYLISSSIVPDINNEKIMVSIYKDITEIRKKEYEQLKYFNILDSNYNEVYIYNLEQNTFDYVNKGALTNLQYSSENLKKMRLNQIYIKLNTKKTAEIVGNLEKEKDAILKFETSLKRYDNSLYPAEVSIQMMKKNNEKLLLINAIDISEKTEREQTINKLKQGIEQSPISVIITDFWGNIEYVNKEFKRITGYSDTEVIGENPRILKSDEHDTKFYTKLWEQISAGNVWKGQIKNKKKNGDFFWEEATISPIFDKKNKISNYIALKADITVRKKIENELNRIHLLNDKIIKFSHIGYAICSFDGNFINISDKFTEITGLFSLSQHVNIYNQNILINSGLTQKFELCVSTKTNQHLIAILNDKQGNEIWSDTIFNILNEDSVLITIKDISAVVETKQNLEISKMQFQELTNIITQPVFNIDNTGRITQWNHAFEQLSGYSAEKVEGKSVFEFHFFNKSEQAMGIFNASIEGHSVQNSLVNLKNQQNEELKVMLSTSVHKNRRGLISEIFCIGHDITEMERYKQQLEQKVEQRTLELRESLKKEKELGEMKTKFVSMASHEFRTPLAAISFASSFVQKYWEKIDVETKNKKFEKIEKQVSYMTSMLDDVLTYGKTEAGKVKNLPTLHSFTDFFEPIIEEVKNQTGNTHQIKIIGDYKNLVFEIDEKLGRNIFINLLNNAIKFSPQQSYIQLQIQQKEDANIFKVQDFGIGMSKKDLNTIFSPFNRGSNVETIRGTGLGLAIVKESADIIGAKIFVESELNKGTCFTLIIPKNK